MAIDEVDLRSGRMKDDITATKGVNDSQSCFQCSFYSTLLSYHVLSIEMQRSPRYGHRSGGCVTCFRLLLVTTSTVKAIPRGHISKNVPRGLTLKVTLRDFAARIAQR